MTFSASCLSLVFLMPLLFVIIISLTSTLLSESESKRNVESKKCFCQVFVQIAPLAPMQHGGNIGPKAEQKTSKDYFADFFFQGRMNLLGDICRFFVPP